MAKNEEMASETGAVGGEPAANEGSADGRALKRPAGISRGVANSELENRRGEFNGASDRPYHGSWEGRLETRLKDEADAKLRSEAERLEEATIKSRDSIYSQHGNVGFAGNYQVGWQVEE